MDQNTIDDLSRRSSYSTLATRESLLTRTDKILAHRRARTEAHLVEAEEELKQIEAGCHPKITKLSQGLSRSHSDLIQWDNERKQRLKTLQDQIEEQRKKEITGKPEINCARPQAVDGLNSVASGGKFGSASITGGSVAPSKTENVPHYQRLHKQHEIRQAKLKEVVDRKEAKMKEDAKPILFKPPAAIVANVENAVRCADVGERLYKVAEEHKKKIDKAVEEKAHAEYDDDGHPKFEVRYTPGIIYLFYNHQ
jgi:hypothetical protein